jgi:hypothetical protein
MDPSRNGDNHAIKPPSGLPQKPYTDGHGRQLPPSNDHIRVIGDHGVQDHLRGVQNGWDRNDHGYHHDTWGGHDMWHHYDEFGFHWWGFYIGNYYFWTRYDNGMYWWFDPYWHRWCWLNGPSWWWQDVNGVIYIVIDGVYYQYQDDNGTVVVVPDPAPPVDVPPGPPAPSQPASYYSADATRFVTIDPTDGSAYLYDATVADASDPRAQGRLLGTGVSTVQFAYSTAADGTTQVLQQINLSFSDGVTTAVVDPNGEREVQLPGDGTAVLNNLDDSTVSPVTLSQIASSVTLVDQPGQDSAGENEQVLQQIVVNQQDGTTATFDQDGNSADGSLQLNASPTALRQPAAQTVSQHMQNSAAFRALQGGFSW